MTDSALPEEPAQASDIWACEHASTDLRLMRVAGGGIQYRRQCLRCGCSVGNAVKAATLTEAPPDWNEALRERWQHQASSNGSK